MAFWDFSDEGGPFQRAIFPPVKMRLRWFLAATLLAARALAEHSPVAFGVSLRLRDVTLAVNNAILCRLLENSFCL